MENQNKKHFDNDQYQLILKCSEKKDFTEWNKWYDNTFANLTEKAFPEILLEGADLKKRYLKMANFTGANLRNAALDGADCQSTDFSFASLECASISYADLESARFNAARIENVRFFSSCLENASFMWCYTNTRTSFESCSYNEFTDFTGVGLDSIRIDPKLKIGLKDNIRRFNWKKWLNSGSNLSKFGKNITARPFWFITDYGSSTSRIIISFLLFAFIFGLIYFLFEIEAIPGSKGIVANLNTTTYAIPDNSINGNLYILIRSMYFSIVTMTTLGFGDMYALNSPTIWGVLGCLFLSLQVIIGYVLLGALITRLGILFLDDGPALDYKTGYRIEDVVSNAKKEFDRLQKKRIK